MKVWVHPWDTNRCPPWREANSLSTRPVILCIGVKLQGLHRAAPQQLDQGSDWSLSCKEEEDPQGAKWNRGRHVMCDQVSFSHYRREA